MDPGTNKTIEYHRATERNQPDRDKTRSADNFIDDNYSQPHF